MTPATTIGEYHMSAAMELLANAFSRPFGAKAKGQVEVYLRGLERDSVTPEELVAAVDVIIRTTETFPHVATIRSAVSSIRSEAKAAAGWKPEDREDRCPSCRRLFYYAGYQMPDGTVLPRWRCACYPTGSGWFTPAARAWIETDPLILRTYPSEAL